MEGRGKRKRVKGTLRWSEKGKGRRGLRVEGGEKRRLKGRLR